MFSWAGQRPARAPEGRGGGRCGRGQSPLPAGGGLGGHPQKILNFHIVKKQFPAFWESEQGNLTFSATCPSQVFCPPVCLKWGFGDLSNPIFIGFSHVFHSPLHQISMTHPPYHTSDTCAHFDCQIQSADGTHIMPDQGIPLVKYFFHYVAFGVAFLWYETAKFEDKWSQINKLLTLVFIINLNRK